MRILIVHDTPQDPFVGKLKDALRALSNFPDPMLTPMHDAERKFHQNEAELIIVCLPSANPDYGLEVIGRLREISSGHLLAVGKITDPKLILHSLQVGADVFLDEAELETELEAALSRLRVKEKPSGRTGRLLGVLSASGGSGSSTLAVNIAAHLAREHGQANLIDLNAGWGDLAVLLDLRPQYTLADVCRNENRLDPAMFEKMLVRHSSGIHLLAASQQLEDVRILTARGITRALNLSRKLFAEVVVDLEDCVHEDQVAVLQQASGILLVCRLDFASLRNLRRIIYRLHELDIPKRRIRVVINQHGRPNELPVDEAEEALGERLSHFVPYDPRIINAANNSGIPAVQKDPNHKVVQSIAQLAKINFEEPTGSSGIFPKLRQMLSNH